MFVSISPDGRATAEGFVQAFGIEWPCIYGAPRETFEALGAVDPVTEQVAPTLYVVGRDGKVAWSDDAGRYRHKDVATATEDLGRAIDEALQAPRSAGR